MRSKLETVAYRMERHYAIDLRTLWRDNLTLGGHFLGSTTLGRGKFYEELLQGRSMPNGNPDFDPKAAEQWFAPIAGVLESFAQRHNLLVDLQCRRDRVDLFVLARGRLRSLYALHSLAQVARSF
jgi:hypothetical protein